MLYFDMLSESIESQALHCEYVTGKLIRTLRRIDSVLPVALIKKPVEEIRLSVQAKTAVPVFFLYGERPERKIRTDTVLFCFYRELIQIRILRCPQMRISDIHMDHRAFSFGIIHFDQKEFLFPEINRSL